jgi:maltokinase
MATASARDLLASPDVAADEAGGDFASEAYRIGEAVGAVHATLAATLSTTEARPPVARMVERLEVAARQLPAIANRIDDIRALFAAADAPTPLQRVHGDLHLGQVLRTSDRWLLIDFEGEPGQPIVERRELDSPLRDVAGMLRSFDYASHQPRIEAHDVDDLAHRSEEWARRNSDAFCDGYAAASGSDPREHAALLRAYEVDKLVYEIAYESRYRPAWAWIPMYAFDRVFASSPGR